MLYLKLFHGRQDPAASLNDWGSNGPIFGPYQYVHTTYGRYLKMGHDADDVDELFAVEDMIYYDGRYYGDWSVFPEELLEKQDLSLRRRYDLNKARLPEIPGDADSAPRMFPVKIIVYIQGGVCLAVKTNLPADSWEYALVDYDNDPDLPEDHVPFREAEMKTLPSLTVIPYLREAATEMIDNWESGDLATSVRHMAGVLAKILKQ